MDSKEANRFPDELFRKKLEGYESPVDVDVWDRLNGRLNPKPKRLWNDRRIQAAALVGGVLIAAGVWLVVNQSSPGDARSKDLTASIVGDRIDLPEIEDMPSAVISEVPVLAAQADESVAKSVSESERKPSVVRELTTEPRVHEEAFEANAGLPSDKVSRPVAAIDHGASKTETRVLVVYVTPPQLEVTTDEPLASVPTVTSESEIEDAAPATVSVEKKKKGIQRFFRQLKNAKTGEKIDWDELGINPHRVFANVEHVPHE